MTASYRVTDELFLWWLADPQAPVLVGSLRHVRRKAHFLEAGVSARDLAYLKSQIDRPFLLDQRLNLLKT